MLRGAGRGFAPPGRGAEFDVNETMVTVTGNVAGDVVSRRVGANEEHLLVTFRVASSERRWDKASESWVDGDRFTASVNCWRRLAEGARASLVKGDPVVVTGRLSVREYESETGRRYMTEIAATAVGPDLSRCTAEVRRRRLSGVDVAEQGTGEGGTGTDAVGATSEGTVPAAVHEADEFTVEGATAAGPQDEARTGDAAQAPEETAETTSTGATVTGITAGDRRRAGASRASA
jgi:single-strand DNA-binding protein